ncbi:hypothetical protein FP435_03030 [Lactobacillus sp. PV037]|uniref:hypothetical protein n=1 Tax=unclassified Lactobacillus TaxID=2620435 RepID=UPI00223FA293|nr:MULTISPECIES: hypothetical protein [unclassified Lactobacillus]QNQ82402.1 hypothetical protein FP433_04800 [Lactobacillus sp. PV012]QNQ83485.1 hypothetical protein FP435_03030 [Lactobacillus sp. PV037]
MSKKLGIFLGITGALVGAAAIALGVKKARDYYGTLEDENGDVIEEGTLSTPEEETDDDEDITVEAPKED